MKIRKTFTKICEIFSSSDLFIDTLFFVHLGGKYDQAITFYSKAIELNPYVASYYGNRSICNIKMECFGSALMDANEAIKLDRKYVKVRSK